MKMREIKNETGKKLKENKQENQFHSYEFV